MATRLGVDPVVLRLAFVVLACAGGFGVAAYLIAWLAFPEGGHEAVRPGEGTLRRTIAVGLVVGGLLLLLRSFGLWFGDALVGSVALAAFGSAVIWSRSGDARRARMALLASRLPRAEAGADGGRISRARIAIGGALVLGGMAIFLAASDALAAARNVAFAVAVTATGLALILGPWMWRLARQLADERRERIRSEERAEMAAHLHDSVLQTLALIQRARGSEEMVSLARGQERDLRAWLQGRVAPEGQTLLSVALDDVAGRVEQIHHVKVDTVVVGDCPVDDRLRALVDAAGEAMHNAAKHSGANLVSVYVEVEPDVVTAYVRDQGSGFDPDSIPADRRGIATSIRERVDRHGGSVVIVSDRGEGTEVSLRMPRRAG